MAFLVFDQPSIQQLLTSDGEAAAVRESGGVTVCGCSADWMARPASSFSRTDTGCGHWAWCCWGWGLGRWVVGKHLWKSLPIQRNVFQKVKKVLFLIEGLRGGKFRIPVFRHFPRKTKPNGRPLHPPLETSQNPGLEILVQHAPPVRLHNQRCQLRLIKKKLPLYIWTYVGL